MKKIAIICCVILIVTLTGCDLNPIVNKLNGNENSKVQSEEQGKELPDGTVLYKESVISKNTVVEFKDDKENELIDNNDIVKVYAKFSEYNNYYIEFEFTASGQTKFANATKENVGKTITISANNEILSSPTIQYPIDSGNVVVANNQSYDELITLFDKITK